jgi:hypothetical protein
MKERRNRGIIKEKYSEELTGLTLRLLMSYIYIWSAYS